MKNIDIFVDTTMQKIINFLAAHPSSNYFDSEIARLTKISTGASHSALKQLLALDLVKQEKRGRMNFYQVNINNPLIKQFKILTNIAYILSLIKKLAPLSDRIVLFGSSARGEDSEESDTDLLIVSRNNQEIHKIIERSKLKRKVRPIIKTEVSLSELEKKDPLFFQETQQGLTLWSKEYEH